MDKINRFCWYTKYKLIAYKNVERRMYMALMECPHCGEQISDKAGRCPHCGREVCHTNDEMEAAMLRNCAECGACSPEGAEECPYCGCPVSEKTYSGAKETDCDMTGQDVGNAASEEAERILSCSVPGSGQENVMPDEKNTGHKKKVCADY